MSYTKMSGFVRKNGAAVMDVRFTDLWGTWQHLSMPIRYLREAIREGKMYDGSSIVGSQRIEESDMLFRVDPNAPYFMDPFTEHKTLVVFADTYDPVTGKPYEKDPRGVAKRAEAYLRRTRIGDTLNLGVEPEFFVFDRIQFGNGEKPEIIPVSEELQTQGENHGYRQRKKSAYFPLAPDRLQDLRTAIMLHLEKAGIPVEMHHHEVGVAQNELDMQYAPLVRTADQLKAYQHFVVSEARRRNRTATFLPKVFADDNGSGMHAHQSIWNDGTPLFAGREYAGLSREAIFYIGGLLAHADALTAIIASTPVSYKRLVPGFEAPNLKGFSARNRSALCRIPVTGNPKAKRVEFRAVDPICNLYLGAAAMLMAGLDGIKRKTDPGSPVEHDFYELDEEKRAEFGIVTLPGSLGDSLKALEHDHDFLMEGGVFNDAILQAFLDKKRQEITEFEENPAAGWQTYYSYGV